MLRKFTKKRAVLALSLVAGLAIAGTAFAYFTSTGNGKGSAKVGTASTWTVDQTATSTGSLYPDAGVGGANVLTNKYTVTNPGSGSQNLASVAIKVANSDGSAWYSCAGDATPDSTSHICGGGTTPAGLAANGQPACAATDFSVGGKTAGTTWTDTSLGGDFAAGDSKTADVTVEMIDDTANQDNCQGVTVPLYYSAS